MTYIEFFDITSVKNIISCLTNAPDRVICIGDNSTKIKSYLTKYQEIFSSRGNNIEFICKTAPKNKLDKVVEMLCEIVETYDDCVFDITGGDELYNLALGVVFEKFPEKNIQIHRINAYNNELYDCDKDGNTITKKIPSLSICENIKAYGGEIVFGTVEDKKATYRWNLTDEFLADTEKIWTICKKDVRFWNVQINVFEAANEIGKTTEDGLTTVVSKNALEAYLKKNGGKYIKAEGIIAKLKRIGMITHFDDETDSKFTVSYKNKQIKRVLTKAGQILELKVYLIAKNMTEKDGTPIYNDVINGAFIDWDGKFHDEKTENIFDTENEIDVFLMRGVIPIFISCKNGAVYSDELYKLETVATRFGGKYAKKVLVTTALDTMGESGDYLRQRAKDMNIRVIENVQNIDDFQFAKKLNNLWNN